MKKLFLILITLLFFVGCSNPLDEAKTCSESMTDTYTAGCKLYDGNTGYEYTATEATILCRKFVDIVLDKCPNCEDELAKWLDCQPTKTYSCTNCNDEYDRALTCCAK